MKFSYAQVKDNTVVGLYEYAQVVVADDLILIEETTSVSIGDTYLSGVFSQVIAEQEESEAEQQLMPVVIDQVTGALTGFSDSDNQYTVNENAEVIATGTLAVPDQKFRVPFKRLDTGRIQLMVAEVVEGKFTLTMNFKTGGIWVVNNKLVNTELAQPMFSIDEYRFAVI